MIVYMKIYAFLRFVMPLNWVGVVFFQT